MTNLSVTRRTDAVTKRTLLTYVLPLKNMKAALDEARREAADTMSRREAAAAGCAASGASNAAAATLAGELESARAALAVATEDAHARLSAQSAAFAAREAELAQQVRTYGACYINLRAGRMRIARPFSP